MGIASDDELAAVVASSAYDRAATALTAGIELCEDHEPLTTFQKSTLLQNALAHFQGLDGEILELIRSAQTLESALEASRRRL